MQISHYTGSSVFSCRYISSYVWFNSFLLLILLQCPLTLSRGVGRICVPRSCYQGICFVVHIWWTSHLPTLIHPWWSSSSPSWVHLSCFATPNSISLLGQLLPVLLFLLMVFFLEHHDTLYICHTPFNSSKTRQRKNYFWGKSYWNDSNGVSLCTIFLKI